jgi:hypothetical protein
MRRHISQKQIYRNGTFPSQMEDALSVREPDTAADGSHRHMRSSVGVTLIVFMTQHSARANSVSALL